MTSVDLSAEHIEDYYHCCIAAIECGDSTEEELALECGRRGFHVGTIAKGCACGAPAPKEVPNRKLSLSQFHLGGTRHETE
jgi:hypothetical protein